MLATCPFCTSSNRLDADLIILALATHEPHFCILREKVIVRSFHAKKVVCARMPGLPETTPP